VNRLADAALAVFLLAGVTIGLSAPAADAQTVPATGGTTPTGLTLQAELLQAIDASQAKVGDEVAARTITPLEFGGTKFPPGATVIGHIKQAEPSRLVLVFDHIVIKKKAPVPVGLSLRAVMLPQSLQSTGNNYLRGRRLGVEGQPRIQGSKTHGAGGTFCAVRKLPRKIQPSRYFKVKVPSKQATEA
jgi:hypothetical protein